MRTIGGVLDANRGVGPGFDFLRVFLAFGVIAWHSVPIATGSSAGLNTEPYWILVYAIVPMFFALSGFLVTGSALRLTLPQFIASRALRIVPALFVDTAVSVLVFGVLFTALPITIYATSPDTIKYWLNCVGEIHFYLPGVFKSNPISAVNGSLWTIRPELGCYVAMAALIATGLVRRWPIVLGLLVALWAASLVGQQIPTSYFGKYLLTTDAAKLVIFFLAGSLTYLLRQRIPMSRWLVGVALAFIACCALFGTGRGLWNSRSFMLISCPLLTYLMVWLGMQPLPKIPLFDRGDYSYGVYLYGFPIQQVVEQTTHTSQPIVVFLATTVPVTLLAMCSWHFVEKPTLRLRKYLTNEKRREPQLRDEPAKAA